MDAPFGCGSALGASVVNPLFLSPQTMPESITLTRFSAEPLDLPLHVPFGIAGGAQDVARNALVTLELADGTIGLGEAAPFPAYNGETQALALSALRLAAPAVLGREVALASWRDLAAAFNAAGGRYAGSAQAAFEMALLDALTKRAGIALVDFFGGRERSLAVDMTITTGTLAQAESDARAIVARGFQTLKVKVGGTAGPMHDLARLTAIHRAAPGLPLILDGNAGLSLADALTLADGLRDLGIVPALLEQWLPAHDLAGARRLADHTGWRLAADEAACSVEDVPRLVAAGAAHVVNLKLMKRGVAAAWDVALAARAHGLDLMIGGNVESSLAMSVSAALAGGLGGFAFADLDTPLFLAHEPFTGGLRYTAGTISLAHITTGHGVTLIPTASA